MIVAETEVGASTPDELFGSGAPVLSPVWLAMSIFARQNAVAWEKWRELRRTEILRELGADAGISLFLVTINVPVERLGLSQKDLEDERAALRSELSNERALIEELLTT